MKRLFIQLSDDLYNSLFHISYKYFSLPYFQCGLRLLDHKHTFLFLKEKNTCFQNKYIELIKSDSK